MPGYPRPPIRTCPPDSASISSDEHLYATSASRMPPGTMAAFAAASLARRFACPPGNTATRHGPAHEISGVAEASESQTRNTGGRSNFGGAMIAGSAGWVGGSAGWVGGSAG